MLAHLGPILGLGWPILGHKSRKMGTAKNTVKRGTFWWYAISGGRGGGLSLLRRGEKAYGMDTASSRPRGPLAELKGLTPNSGPAGQKMQGGISSISSISISRNNSSASVATTTTTTTSRRRRTRRTRTTLTSTTTKTTTTTEEEEQQEEQEQQQQ